MLNMSTHTAQFISQIVEVEVVGPVPPSRSWRQPIEPMNSDKGYLWDGPGKEGGPLASIGTYRTEVTGVLV